MEEKDVNYIVNSLVVVDSKIPTQRECRGALAASRSY